jgi:hypothetical protein
VDHAWNDCEAVAELSGPKGITRCLPTRGFVDARRPGSIWKTTRLRVTACAEKPLPATSKGPH